MERLRRTYDVEIGWTAFPLHPETPTEGRSLEELFRGRPVDIREMMKRLKTVARQEGLPFGDRTMTYNSRLAQELGKWAESKEKGDEFHERAFRAYFADGLNLAELPVLIQTAVSAGLPGEEAESVLRERSFKGAVDADWSRSRQMGVTAVPTFMIENQMVVGAQPYEVLERFLCGMAEGREGR